MTIQELLNGVIYSGTLAGALVAILGFLHFAMVRPLRNFLRREVVGGLTDIKDAVEINTTTLENLQGRLDDHISNGGHLSH